MDRRSVTSSIGSGIAILGFDLVREPAGVVGDRVGGGPLGGVDVDHPADQRDEHRWGAAGAGGAQEVARDHAERVDVGALVERIAEPHLGRDVRPYRGRPHRYRRRRVAWPRPAPVDEHHREPARCGGEDDRGRAHVAVHEAAVVRVREDRGDVADDRGGVERRQRAALGDRGQRRAIDELAGDPRSPVGEHPELVDPRDARMVERLDDARLAEQPDRDRLPPRLRRRHHLQRDAPGQDDVDRLVDVPGPAGRQPAFDQVLADACAGGVVPEQQALGIGGAWEAIGHHPGRLQRPCLAKCPNRVRIVRLAGDSGRWRGHPPHV